MSGFMDKFLDNSETIVTVISALILYAILAGPMSYLKPRYKWLMFCIATSILGATLNRFVALFPSYPTPEEITQGAVPGSSQDDASVIVIAKLIILCARVGLVISGTIIIVKWMRQCERIKSLLCTKEVRMSHALEGTDIEDETVDTQSPIQQPHQTYVKA